MGRGLASRLPGALTLACLLASAAPAGAAGRLLSPPGAPTRLEALRAAEARAPDWATVWLSFRVAGASDKFALVLPVPPGSRVDPALDALLDALEHSSAPRVMPPAGAPECGETESSSVEDTSLERVGSLAPSAIAVLSTLAETKAHALSLGLGFGAEDAAALAELGVGTRFVVLAYQPASSNVVTETVRITLPSSSAPLAFGLARSASFPVDVTLFTVGEGRAKIPNQLELDPVDVGATWKLVSAESDYVSERRALLTEQNGKAWLVEASGTSPLFGWMVLPNGAGTVVPAAKRYFDYALEDGAISGSVSSCVAEVWDAVAQGKLGARVSRACAAGTLSDLGAAACSEAPGAGEHPSSELRCGAADDFAFLLSGLYANDARLTRHVGVAGPATPSLVDPSLASGATQSVVVQASESDTWGCVLGNAGSGGAPGASGGPNDGGEWGGGGYAGDYGGGDGELEPVPDGSEETNVSVEFDCWGSSSESDDSCGGDSSSSSEDDSDSCSGDSSSDSAEDGDTCSGDSSSDSSGDGETCGGDSSSSGGDGETCGGDSGSSSGGDSCGSGSSSSGGDGCRVARARGRRVRVSFFTLLAAAIGLPLRRWSRRRRR